MFMGDIWKPAPGTTISIYLRSFVYIYMYIFCEAGHVEMALQTVLQINEAVMYRGEKLYYFKRSVHFVALI